jgi:hypothetical protein
MVRAFDGATPAHIAVTIADNVVILSLDVAFTRLGAAEAGTLRRFLETLAWLAPSRSKSLDCEWRGALSMR